LWAYCPGVKTGRHRTGASGIKKWTQRGKLRKEGKQGRSCKRVLGGAGNWVKENHEKAQEMGGGDGSKQVMGGLVGEPWGVGGVGDRLGISQDWVILSRTSLPPWKGGCVSRVSQLLKEFTKLAN